MKSLCLITRKITEQIHGIIGLVFFFFFPQFNNRLASPQAPLRLKIILDSYWSGYKGGEIISMLVILTFCVLECNGVKSFLVLLNVYM